MTAVRLRGPSAGAHPATDALLLAGAAGLAALYALSAYAMSPFLLPAAVIGGTFVVLALQRPEIGIAGAFLLSPLENTSLPLPTGSLSASEATMALVGLGYAARLLFWPGTVRAPAARDLVLLGLVATALAGMAVAIDPSPISRVSVLWLLFVGVYLQVQSFDRDRLEGVVVALLVGAGILGVLGTLAYLRSGNDVVYAGGRVTGARAVGTWLEPNYYASFLQLAILPGLALVLGRGRRLWLALPLVAAVAGLAFSLSRGAMLGLGAGLLLLLAWQRARRVAVALVIVVSVLTVAGANPIVNSAQFTTVTERLSAVTQVGESSTNNRPRIWGVAIEETAAHPVIGIGLNQFRYYASAHGLTEGGGPLENAHNLFLSVAVELGLVGLALFLTWLVQVGGRLVAALRHTDPRMRGLALGIGAALIGFLVQGLTVAQIRDNLLMATFLTLAGMLTAIADRARSDPS